MSIGSSDWVQAQLQMNRMDADIKLTTWYGFKLWMGWTQREVNVVQCNRNGKCLVQDKYTGRKFIMDERRELVQYFPETDAKHFAA